MTHGLFNSSLFKGFYTNPVSLLYDPDLEQLKEPIRFTLGRTNGLIWCQGISLTDFDVSQNITYLITNFC